MNRCLLTVLITHTVIDKNESVGQRLGASLLSNVGKLSFPFTATHGDLIK